MKELKITLNYTITAFVNHQHQYYKTGEKNSHSIVDTIRAQSSKHIKYGRFR